MLFSYDLLWHDTKSLTIGCVHDLIFRSVQEIAGACIKVIAIFLICLDHYHFA